MSEMVERVARASFAFWKAQNSRVANFEDMNPDELEFAMAHAHAAIEAMREPIENVVCAGDEKIIEALNDHAFALRDPTPAAAAWNAMIDAALNEKKPGSHLRPPGSSRREGVEQVVSHAQLPLGDKRQRMGVRRLS